MPTLILMAKAPCSGMAKTRLVPPYSRHQAAEIADILLRLSVDICARHWAGELVIAGWPDTDHQIFSELEKQYQVTLASQSKGDLGEKMQCLLATAFERNTAACGWADSRRGVLFAWPELSCDGSVHRNSLGKQ